MGLDLSEHSMEAYAGFVKETTGLHSRFSDKF
jgi:hypothetical protein